MSCWILSIGNVGLVNEIVVIMKRFSLLLVLLCGCTFMSDGSEDESPDETENAETQNAAVGPTEQQAGPVEQQTVEPKQQAPADDVREEEIGVGFFFDTTEFEVLAGDSLRVKFPSGEAVVKLYGVAAPSKGQPLHEPSKNVLTGLLKKQNINVRVRAVSEDGVFSVDVKIPPNPKSTGGPNGHNLPPKLINGEMVRRGLAKHDTAEAPVHAQLESCQEIAQRRRVGIWDSRKGQ